MESKHTPGPWESRDGQVWGPNPHEDGDILICDTAPDGDALTEYDADNARLIAAAPDLLAALELVNVDKDGDGFICAEGMDQVRAAIAKARGQ